MKRVKDEQYAQLVSITATMTGLVRIKYGNLDPDVYAMIEKAESLLGELDVIDEKPSHIGTLCGCGRPGVYTSGIHTDNWVYSCNKYKRCPTYRDLEEQLQKRNSEFTSLLKAANSVTVYRDGTTNYEAACSTIKTFTTQDTDKYYMD